VLDSAATEWKKKEVKKQESRNREIYD